MPSPAFTKLRARLAELFQLDAAAELDFGIYRILNCRRGEIAKFLDSLEQQVEAILGQAGADAGAPIRAELEKTIAELRALGVEDHNIETNKNVKALREKLAALGAAGQDTAALRDDIFSLLTTFFSRCYKDGDFLSLHRCGADLPPRHPARRWLARPPPPRHLQAHRSRHREGQQQARRRQRTPLQLPGRDRQIL